MTVGAGDQAPLERVWQATRVWLPGRPEFGGRPVRDVERALAAVSSDTTLPSIVYLHGCRGFDEDLPAWAAVLSGAGYAVFAPEAAARGGPPPACERGLYAPDDAWRFAQREADVRYVARQLRTLLWVEPESIVLFGFDQGAVIAAGWREREFAGFVITGWTCTSPDMRAGLLTPVDRPVLAIRWEQDPFFRDPAWNGDCEVHLGPRPGSRALVLEGQGHSTASSADARDAVLRFLRARTLR